MIRDLRSLPLGLEERLAIIIGVEVFGNTKLFVESKTGVHRNTITRICAGRRSIIEECNIEKNTMNHDRLIREKAHDLLVKLEIRLTETKYNLEKRNVGLDNPANYPSISIPNKDIDKMYSDVELDNIENYPSISIPNKYIDKMYSDAELINPANDFNETYENISKDQTKLKEIEKSMINRYFLVELGYVLFSTTNELFSIDLNDIPIPTYEEIQEVLSNISGIMITKNKPRFTRLDVKSTVSLSSQKILEIIDKIKHIYPEISIK